MPKPWIQPYSYKNIRGSPKNAVISEKPGVQIVDVFVDSLS